ncbi:hypothetical protein L1887_31554 [Cichorium endivia]|nr:hypothetical protein L1887_31554 [Cichorium endivia]
MSFSLVALSPRLHHSSNLCSAKKDLLTNPIPPFHHHRRPHILSLSLSLYHCPPKATSFGCFIPPFCVCMLNRRPAVNYYTSVDYDLVISG